MILFRDKRIKGSDNQKLNFQKVSLKINQIQEIFERQSEDLYTQ